MEINGCVFIVIISISRNTGHNRILTLFIWNCENLPVLIVEKVLARNQMLQDMKLSASTVLNKFIGAIKTVMRYLEQYPLTTTKPVFIFFVSLLICTWISYKCMFEICLIYLGIYLLGWINIQQRKISFNIFRQLFELFTFITRVNFQFHRNVDIVSKFVFHSPSFEINCIFYFWVATLKPFSSLFYRFSRRGTNHRTSMLKHTMVF